MLTVFQNQTSPISKELQVEGCSVLRGRTSLEVLYFRLAELRKPDNALYSVAVPENVMERSLNDGPAAVERIFSRSKLFLTGKLKESTVQMLMILIVNKPVWEKKLSKLWWLMARNIERTRQLIILLRLSTVRLLFKQPGTVREKLLA